MSKPPEWLVVGNPHYQSVCTPDNVNSRRVGVYFSDLRPLDDVVLHVIAALAGANGAPPPDGTPNFQKLVYLGEVPIEVPISHQVWVRIAQGHPAAAGVQVEVI